MSGLLGFFGGGGVRESVGRQMERRRPRPQETAAGKEKELKRESRAEVPLMKDLNAAIGVEMKC